MREHSADTREFIYRHLTAAMVMQRLERRLGAEDTVESALEHLDSVNFDVSVFVDRDHVFFVKREQLRGADGRELLERYKNPFPSSRIISSTLPLGPLAERLEKDQIPLLVVGPEDSGLGGPQYIVTRADFAAPAGVAAALCLVAVLDSGLAKGLSEFDDEEVLETISADRRAKAEESFRKRASEGEETRKIDVLHLSDRLTAWNKLHSKEQKLCSSNVAGTITTIRNDLTHGRLAKLDGDKILNFVTTVSRAVADLDSYMDRSER